MGKRVTGQNLYEAAMNQPWRPGPMFTRETMSKVLIYAARWITRVTGERDEALDKLARIDQDRSQERLGRMKAERYLRERMQDAYLAGWMASGEGSNGEHPGDGHLRPDWAEERDQWIDRRMRG